MEKLCTDDYLIVIESVITLSVNGNACGETKDALRTTTWAEETGVHAMQYSQVLKDTAASGALSPPPTLDRETVPRKK